MATFSFDAGITTSVFSTPWAFRIRVSMSAMGSLMLIVRSPRLPAGLDEARDVAPHRGFADLGPRQAELAERAARTAGDVAAVAQPAGAGVARQCLQALHRVHALVHRAGLVVDDRLQLGAPGRILLDGRFALGFAVLKRKFCHVSLSETVFNY